MYRRARKHLFLAALAALLATLFLRRWLPALAVFVGLFAWLLFETRRRGRFRFVADAPCPEQGLRMDAAVQGLAVSKQAPWALLVQAGPRAALVDLERGALRWQSGFSAPPLALLARPDGGLLWASEAHLHLSDAAGKELRSLPFEPPLYRQSYRLWLSADGRHAALHTPWFIQAFDPELGALGARLRYEDAGHFLKYAAFSESGARLYAGGALLLDPEEGGAGMEARWDAWDLRDGAWRNAWRQVCESYDNSHLRGISLSDDGRLLCVELWQNAYETRFYGPDGALLGRRSAEHPQLSPDGQRMVWETHFDGIAVGTPLGTEIVHQRRFGEKIRLKAPHDDGSCLVLAGRHLCVLGPDGGLRWDAWFKNDPQLLGLGPQGRLALALDAEFGVLQLPWPPR